jgi:DNA-binding MarR family transcriptional regulator
MEEEQGLSDIPEPIAPMALFVMALVDKAGANSLYDLKRIGKVSSGAVRHVLSDLENKGYLQRDAPAGELRKKSLSLTQEGKQALVSRWPWTLRQASQAEMETVLRTLWVARTMNGETAATFLRAAIDFRRTLLSQQPQKPQLAMLKPTAAGYLSLLTEAQRKQLECEIELLEDLCKRL